MRSLDHAGLLFFYVKSCFARSNRSLKNCPISRRFYSWDSATLQFILALPRTRLAGFLPAEADPDQAQPLIQLLRSANLLSPLLLPVYPLKDRL